MIPASYMFKDIYHQHWEVAEEEVAPARHEPRGGIAIAALLALAGQALAALREAATRRAPASSRF